MGKSSQVEAFKSFGDVFVVEKDEKGERERERSEGGDERRKRRVSRLSQGRKKPGKINGAGRGTDQSVATSP
jgi:hypothetical protein